MALRHGPSARGALCRLFACLLATAVGGALAARPAIAQSASIDDVKAAFLFNFTKFIEWPADAFPSETTPFVIGILGDDPAGNALREIVRGKTVNGHELRLKRVSVADDLAQLHVLFIGKSDQSRVPDILARATGKALLTVSDVADFCSSGGIIQFHNDHSLVKFQINQGAALHSRLKISSKLLSLASIVHTKRD